MTTIPTKPANVVWTGMELFGDCRYVYVRLEDHSCANGAHASVRDYLLQLGNITKTSEEHGQPGAYALAASPWLAEELYQYANCELIGVTRAGTVTQTYRSRNHKLLRPQGLVTLRR